MKGAVADGLFAAVVVVGGVVIAASGLVINGLTGWIASAALIWAVWAHHTSSIPEWLFAVAIVAAAVYLFLLGVALPYFVKTFMFPVQVALVAAAIAAWATTQWFPAVVLCFGALLGRGVRAAAAANDAHCRDC